MVNAGHLPLRMNLGGSNVVCWLREKHIHLDRSSDRRSQFRAHINTVAAYVAAQAFAALHNSPRIAPGEYDREPQTKALRASSLFCTLSLFHDSSIALHTRSPNTIAPIVRTTANLRQRGNL